MNAGTLWEIVRPFRLLPVLRKGGRRASRPPGRKPGPPRGPEEECSRAFLLGAGDQLQGGAVQVGKRPPAGKPRRGFLAVYVGPEMRRFEIPAGYLCTPAFRELMEKSAEEFGFRQEGGLQIPCDVAAFEEILRRAAAVDRVASSGKGGRRAKRRPVGIN